MKGRALAAGFEDFTLSAVGVDSDTPRENINAFIDSAGMR